MRKRDKQEGRVWILDNDMELTSPGATEPLHLTTLNWGSAT